MNIVYILIKVLVIIGFSASLFFINEGGIFILHSILLGGAIISFIALKDIKQVKALIILFILLMFIEPFIGYKQSGTWGIIVPFITHPLIIYFLFKYKSKIV
ncbi:hypothetical protein [Alkalibacillus haloalkaliphilus]|uniref:hypothetical protein n=1 Tax=Alkalibacillus haloalkaliphilus TaxID=94136 RepID=UPI00037BB0FF|nr:hypothetical protein [Alkalibacillus haloalkaliphilus]